MRTRRSFLSLLGLVPFVTRKPESCPRVSTSPPTRLTRAIVVNSEAEIEKLIRGGQPALRRFLLESRDRISL